MTLCLFCTGPWVDSILVLTIEVRNTNLIYTMVKRANEIHHRGSITVFEESEASTLPAFEIADHRTVSGAGELARILGIL